MTDGIVYVAYGDKARAETRMSLNALRAHTGVPAASISAEPIAGTRHIPFSDPRWGARWAKLNLDQLTPFDCTLYLDADTRPRGDPAGVFSMLHDGFDLVIAGSTMQGDKALWHVGRQERQTTLDSFGFTPIQLQAGVFAFSKNARTAALFAAWREEWLANAEPTQDQAALLRALYRVPVKVWLMSHALSEALVAHLWGRLH